MARADTYTIIPLDRVAEVLGIDPLHFNGVVSSIRPERDSCDDMWAQYDWQQAGKISRETLAYVLYMAEEQTAEILGFYPAPKWISNEEHRLTTPNRVESFNVSGRNSRAYPKTIRTKFGEVVETGQKAKVLVEAGVAIVYSDSDGDGYNETATITTTTTVTDIEELRVYYPSKSGADIWEIRPVNVSINTTTGVATITFRREQCVLPELLGTLQDPGGIFRALDGDDNNNFLTTVDVYNVYTDPQAQATFTTTYSSCATSPDTLTTESGLLIREDSRRGILSYQRANWDAVNSQFTSASFTLGREPDKINIYYRSGLLNYDSDYPHLRMNPMWERAIIFYAFTLVDTDICGCANLEMHISKMREDITVTKQGAFNLMHPADLTNPFNTTRAGLQLWRLVKHHRLVYAR